MPLRKNASTQPPGSIFGDGLDNNKDTDTPPKDETITVVTSKLEFESPSPHPESTWNFDGIGASDNSTTSQPRFSLRDADTRTPSKNSNSFQPPNSSESQTKSNVKPLRSPFETPKASPNATASSDKTDSDPRVKRPVGSTPLTNLFEGQTSIRPQTNSIFAQPAQENKTRLASGMVNETPAANSQATARPANTTPPNIFTASKTTPPSNPYVNVPRRRINIFETPQNYRSNTLANQITGNSQASIVTNPYQTAPTNTTSPHNPHIPPPTSIFHNPAPPSPQPPSKFSTDSSSLVETSSSTDHSDSEPSNDKNTAQGNRNTSTYAYASQTVPPAGYNGPRSTYNLPFSQTTGMNPIEASMANWRQATTPHNPGMARSCWAPGNGRWPGDTGFEGSGYDEVWRRSDLHRDPRTMAKQRSERHDRREREGRRGDKKGRGKENGGKGDRHGKGSSGGKG